MPKRPSPLEEPPSASSSSEESEDVEVEGEGEEEEDDDDEESEEEQEEQITSVKSSGKKPSSSTKSNATEISTPQPRSHSDEVSDSDEDSDADSASDSEPSPEKAKPSAPNVKPISSKPMAENAKSKKPSSANTAAPAHTATPTKGSKRSLEMDKSEKESKQKTKKKKKEAGDAEEEDGRVEETEKKQGGGEDSKKLFQRIWSDEDEIVILKALLSYKKKGLNPTSNLNAFLDSIKGSLHIDVNRTQLNSKLHRLKHRYFSQASRGKDGEDPHFTKPHEGKAYQLSKKIWGDKEGKEDGSEANNAGSDSVKTDAKKSKGGKIGNGVVPILQPKVPVVLESHLEASENREEEQLLSLGQFGKSLTMPPSVLADYIAKEGSAILGSAETKEFEQKWRKLLLSETKIYIQRLELAREYSKAIADKLEAADS